MQFKLATFVFFLFIGYVHADCPVVNGAVSVCTKGKCDKMETTVSDLMSNIRRIKNTAETTNTATSKHAKEISEIRRKLSTVTELDNNVSKLEKKYLALDAKISATEKKKKSEVVGFSASKTLPIVKAKNKQKITFDFEQTNIGSLYNGNTGIFTVQDDGLYIFHWTILTCNNCMGNTFLVVNNEVKSKNSADSKSGGSFGLRTGTSSTILSLKRNDKVWINTKWGNAIVGHEWSSFQGWRHR